MGIQVDLLTRGKTAHEKEFIDFEFDGRHISEFGLVAVFGGGRHSLNAIPEFEDETTEVEGLGGQYFWGSRYKAKTRTFTLHTDGMTEAQLNDFKKHFQPGKYGKFIEDKLACRYGWARLSQAVTFNVVPFKTTIQFLGRDAEVNEYKGEGTISFVFDDPFSYSTINYIKKSTGPLNDEELRMIYLNNIPFDARDEDGNIIEVSWRKDSIGNRYPLSMGGGRSAVNVNVIGADWRANDKDGRWYYYNPSNIETKAKLSISLRYSFTSKDITKELTPIYFNEVADSINGEGYNLISSYKPEYNSNKQEVDTTKMGEFRYTSANVTNQINRAIQIAKDFYTYHSAAGTWNVVELEETLRREIVNTKVMAWAASVLRIMMTKTFYKEDTGCFLNNETIVVDLSRIMGSDAPSASALNWFYYFNIFMLCMLANCSNTESYHLEDNAYNFNVGNFGKTWVYTIIFDGINSETSIKYSYNSIVSQELTKIIDWEEKSGEMMCSPYLKLDGGDTLNAEGGYGSCHYLIFEKSNGATVSPVSAALEYTYTYL